MSDYTPRQELVLRKMADQIAYVMDRTPETVRGQLEQAIAAGLLKVTRRGLQATIPDGAGR